MQCSGRPVQVLYGTGVRGWSANVCCCLKSPLVLLLVGTLEVLRAMETGLSITKSTVLEFAVQHASSTLTSSSSARGGPASADNRFRSRACVRKFSRGSVVIRIEIVERPESIKVYFLSKESQQFPRD
ncbi:jg26594 [Pararge aegeria aegeria]|uniref:Jg26594 protein n=1 Tax=Pararge aegeria aegeria TaxID=348720 RepID=A0A8S4QT68_9NEOP|nr:jg26594 [Pararge aegeria aegeria]